jgi:hypothetical protein
MSEKILRIGANECRLESPGVYYVPLNDLGDFRLSDMLPSSSIWLTDLVLSVEHYRFSIHITHSGGGDDYSIQFYVGFPASGDVDAKLNRIRRSFLPLVERDLLPDPLTTKALRLSQEEAGASYIADYSHRGRTVVLEAIARVLAVMRKLSGPEARVFICHASEDKASAASFADHLSQHGAGVWFDHWEIKVGDSIVQKINEGLADASHLAILLSRSSVAKPWVQRELSAALMRHLRDRSIGILPLLLEECEMPPLLADLKYADCRVDPQEGFRAAVTAVLARP